MSKIKGSTKWRTLLSTFVFVFAVVAGQFMWAPSALAVGVTLVWTGTAGDNKFSTSGNWSTNSVPTSGDIIEFHALDNTPRTLNNDLTGVNLAGLIYGSSNDDQNVSASYTINDLQLQDGASIRQVGYRVNIALSGPVTAAGGLVFDGTTSPFGASGQNIDVSFTNLSVVNAPPTCFGGGSPDYLLSWKPTGTVTVQSGSTYTLVGTEAAAVVQSNATINPPFTGGTVATNLTFAGGSVSTDCGVTYSMGAYNDTTLAGTITLNGNTKYYIANGKTLTITGAINGPSYALSAADGSTGTFVNSSSNNNSQTPDGTQEVPVTTLPPITDDQPSTSLTAASKTIVTLDGSRGSVSVYPEAVLKGTGIANDLYVYSGGIVAPGHSPGKLTVLDTFSLYGTYQAELQNKDLYDMLQVGENYSGSSNAVVLNAGATLQLSLFDGYKINQGETYTVIDNRSSTAVSGTFDGLAEGAQVTVGDAVFSISYVGGDGNDVVLTALRTVAAPATPNTGALQFVTANPLLIAAAGVIAAGAVVVMMRRRS